MHIFRNIPTIRPINIKCLVCSGTAGGFGSPPSFSNTAQPQQSAAGFGSPPAFSSEI